MRTRLLVFAVAVFLLPLASRGQDKDENPFRKAKVGDYATFKMTTSVMGKDIEITMKQTVTAVDDKEVTVKASTSFMGIEVPGGSQSTKIDLTKPYDPTMAAAGGKGKGKFEKSGEGKEKIKIGDKEYDCTWIAGKVTADVKGKAINSDIKAWFAKTVPLSGMVKMEMKSNLANVVMELTETGSAKE
jgi:hypothetical protein